MFENEHTLRSFMIEKTEGQFHDKYEKSLEQIRSEFGKKYPMVIGGEEVKTLQTTRHTSPVDNRILLGHLSNGSIIHVRQAITAAKKAFENWSKVGWQERVRLFRRAAVIMSRRKFEL